MEGASPGPPRQVSWVQDCPVLSLGGRPDSDHPRCAPNRSAPKGDAGTECEEKHKCGASGLAFSGRLSEPGFPEVVLTKMMGKAFKYTPRGGRVLARLEGRGRSATVSVSDTGGSGPRPTRRPRQVGHGERFRYRHRNRGGRLASAGRGVLPCLERQGQRDHGDRSGFDDRAPASRPLGRPHGGGVRDRPRFDVPDRPPNRRLRFLAPSPDGRESPRRYSPDPAATTKSVPRDVCRA